jgi:hypothetical protein
MEKKNGFTASVTRHNVTMEDITSFVKNSIVKFIFLDKNFADISSDKTVNEIHKFKSVYRGNTYIRIPLKMVKGEKYITGIEIDTSDNPDGFAVISKHDLRDLSIDMKKAKKEERIAYGEQICKEYLDKFNKYLSNNILEIVVRDENDNVLEVRLISGGQDFASINKEIRSVIEEVKSRTTEII